MKTTTNTVFNVCGRTMILLLMSVILTACVNMPTAIQSENIAELNVPLVQGQLDQYKGQTVRWGGIITQVINNADDTWIEVLSLELNTSGRPNTNRKNNQGRFIAKIDQFLDPAVYQEGLSLTVIGILSQNIDGKIGEFSYIFPVVAVHGHHLWTKRSYRYNRHILPGYWYYGFHPFWRFGYEYYGYGVRFDDGYYPYYPLYGHLDKRLDPLNDLRDPGIFRPGKDRFWRLRSEGLHTALRMAVHNSRPVINSNNSNNREPRANNTRNRNQSRTNSRSKSTSTKRPVSSSNSSRRNKIK